MDNIRIEKILGSSLAMSSVVKGMVVPRDTEGNVKRATDAKIAVFNSSLDPQSSDTKQTVLLKSAEELSTYSGTEEANTLKIIDDILSSGIKVIICGGSVHEMCMHFLERNGILVLKVASKFDIRRICRSIGATPLVRLTRPHPEELGFADLVEVQEIGSTKVTVIKNEESVVNTILLRGSNKNMMDDAEFAIDDAVRTFKQVLKTPVFVAGAGQAEMQLAKQICEIATNEPGLDQYAIQKFGKALEIIPRMIAVQAGIDGNKIISELYAEMGGVDVEEGGRCDAVARMIYDHLETKKNAIKLATEATATILRVDQIIMSKPAGGPKPQ